MLYAVLSDVHASLEALSAVLADARAAGAQSLVCCGDIVGYHADPEACIDLLRARGVACVAGNHDRVAAGLCEPEGFGPAAARAALWTRRRLSADHRAFLASLPLARVIDGRFLLVHAALHPSPNADLHLSSAARLRRSIEPLGDGRFGVRLAFFGHTHRALVHDARGALPLGETMQLPDGRALLVNPGSVGQPRDGDPRAAYALYDADARRLSLRRVPFDRRATLAAAARAGLAAEAP